MGEIRLDDFCCQGDGRSLNSATFTDSDLVISRRGNRELIFSPLGNQPTSPRVALVGITPGGQSKKFAEYLRSMSVEDAASQAAFGGVCGAPRL